MRIYNEEKNLVLDTITIFLTYKEAQYMRDMLESLIKNIKLHHVHISDEDYQKEITVAIYNDENINEFDERSKQIILNDK